MDVRNLLDEIEQQINPQHMLATEARHLRAMNFETIDYLPLTVTYPRDESIEPFPYAQEFSNPDIMLFNELSCIRNNVLNSVRLGDDYPLQVRSNHGLGIISSIFGCKIKITGNEMPWVIQMEGLERIRQIVHNGVPDPSAGLGQRVYDTCDNMREILSEYPKCGKYIHITQPDMQGPFDNLHLMLGSEMFCYLYDEEELMKELLEMITEEIIKFKKFIMPVVNDYADENKIYIHGGIYSGNILLKEDTATANISMEMYEKFAKPYNQKLFDTFGTGSIHYCGAPKKWHYTQMLSQNLSCLNFGNSEYHDLKGDAKILLDHKIDIMRLIEKLINICTFVNKHSNSYLLIFHNNALNSVEIYVLRYPTPIVSIISHLLTIS